MLPDTISIPDVVGTIAKRLDDAGYEVWCVGGFVRDVLLNENSADIDLATSARPDDVQRLFRRTVPIGLKHGTVAVLDDDNNPHEITTFRRDVSTDGRHATVKFGVSLIEDLARRDFTINAMAYHPLTGQWQDPFHGEADLEAGIIRAVGEPKRRFQEDYLRILRALRFACRFGFVIEDETWRAVVDLVDETRMLSAERVRDEWFRGLQSARTVRGFVERWQEAGALRVWLPEIDAEGWEARLVSVDTIDGHDPVIITALLTSDAETVLRRLKAPNIAIERAASVARFEFMFPAVDEPEEVRRWLALVGTAADDLVTVAAARGMKSGLAVAVETARASGAALTVADLRINGKDLGTLGIKPGPRMGEMLAQLLDDVLKNPSRNTPEWLRARVGASEFHDD